MSTNKRRVVLVLSDTASKILDIEAAKSGLTVAGVIKAALQVQFRKQFDSCELPLAEPTRILIPPTDADYRRYDALSDRQMAGEALSPEDAAWLNQMKERMPR